MEKKVSRREFLKASATAGAVLTAGVILPGGRDMAFAGALQPVPLVKPETGGNAALGLLAKRSSAREWSPEPLPLAVLSEMLWAANGINRPDGRRTAPSASNRQEIDIYVAAPDGAYVYDAKANTLVPILADDIRALCGMQPYVKMAAVNLVYVADTSKMTDPAGERRTLIMGADTGFVGANVYLYCAQAGLATVFRAQIDRPALAKALKLRPEQVITFSQSVGYPKK